jgi:hypothetical protein
LSLPVTSIRRDAVLFPSGTAIPVELLRKVKTSGWICCPGGRTYVDDASNVPFARNLRPRVFPDRFVSVSSDV